MAFNTKINLNNDKVYQSDGQALTLSGNTVIATVGDLRYQTHPTFTGSTQIVDKQYVDAATGSTIYNLGSPAAVTVGGISPNYVLTGKSTNCILQDMLYPELCGTLTAPYMLSLVLAPSTSPLEQGTVISSLSVTANFNQGSISPQYCSASPYRSGAANCYCFTGAQINGLYACTANAATKTVTAYTVLPGANTWGARTCYDAGQPAKSNKNNQFAAGLIAGIASLCENTITGILPYFWGSNASSTITSPIITGGTKVVASVPASTSIIFNATTQYLWFAVPAGTTAKTKWWVCAANAGDVGGTGQLWAASCSVGVTSPYWSGCAYDVYVTCGVTTTAAGVPMCMYY